MILSPPLLSRWCASVSRTAGTLRAGRHAVPALIAAAVVGVASIALVPDSRGVWGAGLAALMVAIAAVDARLFIIPDELTATAGGLGFAYAAVQGADMWLPALGWSLIRGAATALVFLGVRAGYRWWRGRDGIGLGDVKLAAVAGVWLDWAAIPVAVDIAAVAALGACLVLYLMKRLMPQRLIARRGFRRAIRATTRLPFGLFLAPAIWLTWIIETTLLFHPSVYSF